MPTVGFFNLTDFLEELEHHVLGPVPVRVQGYHTSTRDKALPLIHLTFITIAAIHIDGETLVCRFITGKISAMDDVDHPKVEKLNRRNQRAITILRERIEAAGYKVRAGIISTADESQTQADPQGLWTRQELDQEEANAQ